ncbi:MAG: hypothetical protein JRN68_01090 [Nitrososphaerota archaeon]|nr:hypothetical protein [Ferrimicrobium acidiphilum]MDG6933271.1 hypothetical protein [Nitrososphaerota archaeon]
MTQAPSTDFPYRETDTFYDLAYWLRPTDPDIGNAFLRRAAHMYQIGFTSYEDLMQTSINVVEIAAMMKHNSKERLHLFKVATCIARMANSFFDRFEYDGLDMDPDLYSFVGDKELFWEAI